jgi:hypothetical protein
MRINDMRTASLSLFLLLLTLPRLPAEVANPEIDYLLRFIEKSEVTFVRAGKEHTSKEAAAHMKDKLSRAGGRVKTGQQFIQHIPSKSYLSGQPYLVKLPGARGTISAQQWLTEALAKYPSPPAAAR